MVVVEADQKAGEFALAGFPCSLGVEPAEEIARVFLEHAVDQLARADAFLFGAQHDRRAVLVVGADVMHFVAAHALEAYPDVGLDVLDQVAEMDRAVGVGQGAGDEDAAFWIGHRGSRGCGRAPLCTGATRF